MLRILAAFLAVLSLCAPALSQSTNAADERITLLNRQVLEACQEKKYDQALRSLEELNTLQPAHAGNAYNFACVYSLRGNVEEGLSWLDRAVSCGFGGARASIYVPGSTAPAPQWHAQMAEKDLDLSKLRADPRFARLLERMRATQKRVEEYTAAAEVHIPPALAGASELPVLVLLHGSGADKLAIRERWSAFAQTHRIALVVPAAPIPMKESAAGGMRWIDDPVAFRSGQDRSSALQPVDRALAQLESRGIKPAWLCFAGEGEGGTLALQAAFARAKQTRNVTVVEPGFELAWALSQSGTARESGMRISWIDALPADAAQLAAAGERHKRLGEQCQQWGLKGSHFALAAMAGPAEREQALRAHLGSWLASAEGTSGSLPPASK